MIWESDIRLLYNSHITEYDIRHGNVSVMRAFKLCDEELLNEIDALPKEDRNRTVGLMIRDDKTLGEKMEEGFNAAVKGFIEANSLDPETDITDIRRDAIFVVNRPIEHTKFADGIIDFRSKGEYHAMLKLGPKLCFFFPRDETVRVSGLVRADRPEYAEVIQKLKPGMLAFLMEFIEVLESQPDRKKVLVWISNFVSLYKRRELDIEYYREFNREAKFRIHQGDQPILYNTGDDDLIDELDITFNFLNIILPILQILA